MTSQSSWERVEVVDAIVIALGGGLLAGITITIGYTETMAGLFVLGSLLLLLSLGGAYVRLEGLPDREELSDPRELIKDLLAKRRD